MADTATLRTLLERVEQASGPDRELDQDVWHHLGQCAKQEDGTCADYKAPALSASVDAVLALIERALGTEWIAEIQVRADGSCAHVHEFPRSEERRVGKERDCTCRSRWWTDH